MPISRVLALRRLSGYDLRRWMEGRGRYIGYGVQLPQIYRRLALAANLHAEGHAALWRDPDLAIAEDWRIKTKPTAAWAERYA